MAKLKQNKLLTTEQRASCMRITLKEAPFSQRAHALLELDKGNTQATAADLSGLSIGQVKYWIARFRELGMDMFPATLREEKEGEVPELIEPASKEKSPKPKKQKKKTSKKKRNKDKNKKKDKKPGKGRKTKSTKKKKANKKNVKKSGKADKKKKPGKKGKRSGKSKK